MLSQIKWFPGLVPPANAVWFEPSIDILRKGNVAERCPRFAHSGILDGSGKLGDAFQGSGQEMILAPQLLGPGLELAPQERDLVLEVSDQGGIRCSILWHPLASGAASCGASSADRETSHTRPRLTPCSVPRSSRFLTASGLIPSCRAASLTERDGVSCGGILVSCPVASAQRDHHRVLRATQWPRVRRPEAVIVGVLIA